MKFSEIEKIFSSRVAFYLNAGYRINAGTMRGTQGEVAKIDLTNDCEVIRVWLKKTWAVEDISIHRFFPEFVKIVIGRANIDSVRFDDILGYDRDLWDDDFEEVETMLWYQVGKNWYLNEEEVRSILPIKEERMNRAKDSYDYGCVVFPPEITGKIVKNLKKRKCFRGVKPYEISVVHFLDNKSGREIGYYAKIRGSWNGIKI